MASSRCGRLGTFVTEMRPRRKGMRRGECCLEERATGLKSPRTRRIATPRPRVVVIGCLVSVMLDGIVSVSRKPLSCHCDGIVVFIFNDAYLHVGVSFVESFRFAIRLSMTTSHVASMIELLNESGSFGHRQGVQKVGSGLNDKHVSTDMKYMIMIIMLECHVPQLPSFVPWTTRVMNWKHVCTL